jgi:hypothetical protein
MTPTAVAFATRCQPVRSAYQPPANSNFLSERNNHQQPAATSQQYSSLRTNQHQPSATSQPNRLVDSPLDQEREHGGVVEEVCEPDDGLDDDPKLVSAHESARVPAVRTA